jgi:ubiquinone/menaquinone biosynthesis C-methylase UbiE
MDDKYLDKTIEFYDQRAREGTHSSGSTLVELDRFSKPLKPNSIVLDAGCSEGRQASYLASKGLKVIAIDLSSEVIKLAKRRVVGVDFRPMDVRHLEFSDDYFDGIWSNATLLHLDNADVQKALAEFYRTLKPAGLLVVSFMGGSGKKEQQEEGEGKFGRLSRFFIFQTEDSVKQLLEDKGFELIDLYSINEQKRWGKNARDIDWLYAFARKRQ